MVAHYILLPGNSAWAAIHLGKFISNLKLALDVGSEYARRFLLLRIKQIVDKLNDLLQPDFDCLRAQLTLLFYPDLEIDAGGLLDAIDKIVDTQEDGALQS